MTAELTKENVLHAVGGIESLLAAGDPTGHADAETEIERAQGAASGATAIEVAWYIDHNKLTRADVEPLLDGLVEDGRLHRCTPRGEKVPTEWRVPHYRTVGG